MTFKLNPEGDAFVNATGELARISEILENENIISSVYPEYRFHSSYWDLSFQYIYIDPIKSILDVQIVLSNKKQDFRITPPNRLLVDYFVIERNVLPIRSQDAELLKDFLPTLDHDGVPGFTIKELMNFDNFISLHGFEIENSEYKDEVLSNSDIALSQFESVLSVDPYPYQAIGIEWLRSQQSLGRSGAILADVMGLGKTLQAIGFLTHNVNRGKTQNLVVCPGTLLQNWQREISRFSPNLEILLHSGQFRAGTAKRIEGFDVVVTSYDTLIRDHFILESIDWNIVVLDEAQAIKNPRAQRTLRSKNLPRKFGLAVSGTPLENHLTDLWSISDFAEPGLLGTELEFENAFANTSSGAIEVNKLIRPIMLRRRLHQIEHQLPDKIVIDHPLIWPNELNDLYENVRLEALEEFASAGGLVATGRLRKLTTHPLMMEIGPSDLKALSPKYALTLDILDELFANNEKCLIFASYKKIIDLMKSDIEIRNSNTFVKILDGRTEMTERSSLVDEFNNFRGPGVLICNPIVAGAGLNITGANHVIHYNLEWNPAKEDQATFRVYRNGQKKETFIHRLFYVNTIDEVIDDRIQFKRNLSDLSVDSVDKNEEYLAALSISPIRAKE
jgi:SNF2 family DNA or RNA helicase